MASLKPGVAGRLGEIARRFDNSDISQFTAHRTFALFPMMPRIWNKFKPNKKQFMLYWVFRSSRRVLWRGKTIDEFCKTYADEQIFYGFSCVSDYFFKVNVSQNDTCINFWIYLNEKTAEKETVQMQCFSTKTKKIGVLLSYGLP